MAVTRLGLGIERRAPPGLARHDPGVADPPTLFDDPRILVRSAPVDDTCVAELSEAERAAVAKVSPKRLREFATARALARGALTELGVERFDLLNGPDRAPIWPAGIAGSISHCDTRAFVAVGRREAIGTVGVDVEHRAALKRDLWRMTMREEEVAWLDARPGGERGWLALAMFSVKEALYKAQYPRSEQYMGFMALRVELEPAGSHTGAVRCVFQEDVGPFPRGFVARGRYTRLDTGEVVTAVRMPDGSAPPAPGSEPA